MDRARKPMVAAALTVLAGLAAVVALRLLRPPAAAACLTESLADLTAWRWVEPRLSHGFPWQPCTKVPAAGRTVMEVRCPAGHFPPEQVSSSISEVCDAPGYQRALALRTLLLQADQTDEAVKNLEALIPTAPADARLLNDLAAAYLVRAERSAQPGDLLNGFDAALAAVAADAGLPEARFNLALAEEALGLPAEWEGYLSLDRSSSWAGEARQHARRLTARTARTAAASWAANCQRLLPAADAGDRRTLAEIIKPHPAATGRYLEEEVLPGWARQVVQGRSRAAAATLREAGAIAAELADQTGDPYMAEAVGAVTRASAAVSGAARLQALVEGHLALAEARAAEEANELTAAEDEYRQAALFLASAGSPLRAGADLGRALILFKSHRAPLDDVIARTEPIATAARRHHHRYLLGRTLWVRALCLSFLERSTSEGTFDQAIREFEQLGDREDVAGVRARKAGLLSELGQGAEAWREIYQALPELPRVDGLERRHYILGAAAAAAHKLNRLHSALWLQDRAVEMVKEALRESGRGGTARQIEGLRFNLAVSFRARAGIELDAGLRQAAAGDLARARRLVEPEMLEVLGREQLETDPQVALATLTEALSLAPAGENRSLIASLHFLAGRAHVKLGQRQDGEADFRAGIAELRKEETTLLAGRQPGQSEEIWSAYFSRFQAAYRSLVRLLLEDGNVGEAFDYAEEARAFEPLDLVLRQPFAPARFVRLAGQSRSLKLRQIQAELPARTFLLESCALDDRLVLWLVSRDRCQVVTCNLSREILGRWTENLDAQAGTRHVEAFAAALAAPFPDIVSEPLRLIRAALGRHLQQGRVVFIPDGPLYGLPFAALRDRLTGRHVIDDLPVETAPSSTLYVYSLLRDADIPRRHTASSVLLIGDPLSPSAASLPGAASELKRLHRLYPGATVKAGADATAERLLTLARDSSILHFAGHAFADRRRSSRSYLLLTPTPEHPGELYAGELLRRLTLPRTRLVVLAACSSSAGGAVGPEGLAPLVRPLIAAGAPAVVAGLGDLRDQATAELLVRFHRYYRHGQDAAVALRHAQLDLAAEPVLLWAPFQVIGHAASPFPSTHQRRDSP